MAAAVSNNAWLREQLAAAQAQLAQREPEIDITGDILELNATLEAKARQAVDLQAQVATAAANADADTEALKRALEEAARLGLANRELRAELDATDLASQQASAHVRETHQVALQEKDTEASAMRRELAVSIHTPPPLPKLAAQR